MEQIPLEALGLASKWPKLARLQDDLAKFQARHRKADAEATALKGRLAQARGQDLDAEAAAVRRGKKPPEPTHEPAVEAKLRSAERERDVLARTIQAVHEELGAFLAEHQPALFADVLEARGKVAAELAGHAQAALRHFARHEDLGRVVKDLRPAVPMPENVPAARVTNVFAGLHTTRSDGPPRGHVEEILGYLASLGGAGEEGGSDAA